MALAPRFLTGLLRFHGWAAPVKGPFRGQYLAVRENLIYPRHYLRKRNNKPQGIRPILQKVSAGRASLAKPTATAQITMITSGVVKFRRPRSFSFAQKSKQMQRPTWTPRQNRDSIVVSHGWNRH